MFLAAVSAALVIIGAAYLVLLSVTGVADASKAAFDLPFGDKLFLAPWGILFIAAGVGFFVWGRRMFRNFTTDFEQLVDLYRMRGDVALQTVKAMSPLLKPPS